MEQKDIEIFLEIVATRNITRTAEKLEISQSVISTRLKKLESELGYELFLRSKGGRGMELTRQGREFIGIAMRWNNLFEEAALLRGSAQSILRLASPESIYFDFLEPIIMRIRHRYPKLKITAQINDSTAIYEMMENGVIDYGFASYESVHRGIMLRPIYEQPFCLVSADVSDNIPVSPESLDPSREIRLTGGNFSAVDLWREKWFGDTDCCRLEVNSPYMIVKGIRELQGWAVLPRETAQILAKFGGVSFCTLTDAPESRTVYLLSHSDSSQLQSDAVRIFEHELFLPEQA